MNLLQSILLLIQTGLAILVGYLLVLTGASRRAPKTTRISQSDPDCRFLVIIPAHNEEELLPETLDSLAQLQYPEAQYTVHVIADNCSDLTAAVAAQKGAVVHVRQNPDLLGKGYALQWLLNQIWEQNVPHDAVVFLDADTVVSPTFLRVMAARLSRGEKVIQAYYAVRAPEQSWNGSLRYAALSVLHYLRPQGRMVLGGSAGLKGNGMVFAADVMKRYQWPASLTEDIELHMALVLNGERVTFAPDAVVWGEMPNSLSQMHSQHMRWERGRIDMAKQYVPPLLKASVQQMKAGNRRRSFVLFDALMEHIIPPFSVLAGLTAFCLSASLMLTGASSYFLKKRGGSRNSIQGIGKTNVVIGVGLVLAQLIYLLTGLRQVKAPIYVYRNLLYAPLLIIWKLKQYLEVLLTRGQFGWIRTERNKS